MVLTNFELWAADGSSASTLPLDYETNNSHSRHLNPFDPRVVPQLNSNLNHLSSNGYYGFSYVNAVHDTNNNNNTSNINYNNNNNTTYNFMANDVNGMNNNAFTTTVQPPTTIQQHQQTHASSNNLGSSAYAAGHAVSVARCKKRFFVMNDDDVNDIADCTATKNNNKNYYGNNCEVAAKRCRFDDDFSAQYCNDFFQLPSTQIATQSCLMDTEEGFENNNNNNNIEKYEQKLNPQLETLTAQHQQLDSQQQLNSQQQTEQQSQPLPPHLYHQQQHYQDNIQFATIKCHFINNTYDTLALNHTCKIDLEKKTENVLKNHHKPNSNNSIQNEKHYKYYDNDVAANDLKVDDATLFAQLHGGCLHHHQFNKTVSYSGDYTVQKDVINHRLQDENYCEEF